MPPFDLLVPRTETEAVALAGGTDLLLDLDERRVAPRRVVSLRRLPWRRHDFEGGGLRIGGTEPLAVLEADPRLGQGFPALAQAIAAVGSPALREQATVGGNLGRAAPASDLLPVLLAMDAEVETVSRSGSRRLSVDSFLRASRATELGRGELVRSVHLPEARPSSAYLWQRVRPANDISQIGVAVGFSPQEGGWRASLGGVPPRAVLAREVAGLLRGARPVDRDIAAASDRLADHPALVSDRRATEEHRRRLAAILLARAVRSAVDEPGPGS